jgi:hypothetical protein
MCIGTNGQIHTLTLTLTHLHTTHLHTYTLTHLHSYTLTLLHTYTLTHLHTYTLTHTLTHTRTHARTHTHTHTFFHPRTITLRRSLAYLCSSLTKPLSRPFCSCSFPGLRATLHAPPPSSVGCITWTPSQTTAESTAAHHAHPRPQLEAEGNFVPLTGTFSQTSHPAPPAPSTDTCTPSPLRRDAQSRAAARTLLHFVSLARQVAPVGV